VLADALRYLTVSRVPFSSAGEPFSSPIPEPFTWIPPEQRVIALNDGSITSAVLEMFGRPSRDTGLESERTTTPNDNQRLYLLNSTDIQRGVTQSPLLRATLQSKMGRPLEALQALYELFLTRGPTPAEVQEAAKHMKATPGQPYEAIVDLAWALLNTKEFLYRH
jgi:hypothetical protein